MQEIIHGEEEEDVGLRSHNDTHYTSSTDERQHSLKDNMTLMDEDNNKYWKAFREDKMKPNNEQEENHKQHNDDT